MAYIAQTAGFGFNLIARAKYLFAAIKEMRSRRAAYVETVTELRALSDRELDDLGIARYDIQSIAYKLAYGA